MNDPNKMMNRFGMWGPPPPQRPMAPPPQAADDQLGFPIPSRAPPPRSPFGGVRPPGRMYWKDKKAAASGAGGGMGFFGGRGGGSAAVGGVGSASYHPPGLNELQSRNRLKARRFYPKKKFTRFAPFAPRNTTSDIMRAKKTGGLASLVSPATPAVLPTPSFSPSYQALIDMADELGVNWYGSMKGRIRLRSPNSYEILEGGLDGLDGTGDPPTLEEEYIDEVSSDSDVEEQQQERLEVERRLDHDVSRFEMTYPGGSEEDGPASYVIGNRVDDQDNLISQLEEENLTLKERLFLMEEEMKDFRRRLQVLEEKHTRDSSSSNIKNKNDQNDNNKDKEVTNATGREDQTAENMEAAGNDNISAAEKRVGEGVEEKVGTPPLQE